jgi:trk system potassium uptake protein TrkH
MRKSVSSLIISSFLVSIFIGAILLMLPFSTHYGHINPEDAIFTSASAVTVTGLIVVDTATYFTPFGQMIILVLLQIGGLGFMTFSTFGILIMGKGFTLQDRTIIENDFTPGNYKNVKDLVAKIIIVTFIVEMIGAILLYLKFSSLKGFDRVFSAKFHSISAFCNAGFSIFSNSFEDYQGDWGINTVLMVLIILGGIGFLVINEVGKFTTYRIKNLKKRKTKDQKPFRFSLHTKIVVISSLILIIAGFLVIFLEEFLHDRYDLDIGTQALVSLFQSVSARTAGFNTVNFNILSSASVFVIIILMFIGASPGSTGGGIKTTSVSVVIGYFRAQLRGIDRIDLFYRNIPAKTVEKAFIVILISFLLISFFFTLLLTMEPDKEMGDLLFETVSAFGTVGLSKGITADLSIFSKLVISLTMFIGRIGPLTLLIALAKKESRAIRKYPEENIMIG